MSDSAYSERVKGVNDVFREVAANHPEVTYVDAYSVFSAPDGKYAPLLSRGDGKVIRVRADDGVHFTPDGGDILAKAVFDRLDPQCKIMQQAVPGVVKVTIEAKGSSSVPGTRRGGSTPTTPTTPKTTTEPTAPPATSSPPSSAPATSAPVTTPSPSG
jgi:hypothetical protein